MLAVVVVAVVAFFCDLQLQYTLTTFSGRMHHAHSSMEVMHSDT